MNKKQPPLTKEDMERLQSYLRYPNLDALLLNPKWTSNLSFSDLSKEDMIKVYFYYDRKENPPQKGAILRMAEYDPEKHGESVEYLLNEVPSYLADECNIDELLNNGHDINVGLIAGKVAGVIAHYANCGERFIPVISVDPKYRGRGIMKAMIDSVSSGEPLVLKVLNSNHDAITAFERCGFRQGVCEGSYYEMRRENVEKGERGTFSWATGNTMPPNRF